MTAAISLLSAALELAEAGWSVFPCQPHGELAKTPFTEHGHLDATSDPGVIREWWTRRPTAMIGAAVPDSMVVIDIDPRNGGSVEALEALAGPLPVTLTTWSGRGDGGRHFYFLRPPGAINSTMLPAGVDLKVRGYCIVPPSLHPATGKPYRWELHSLAPLSPMLRALLRPKDRIASPTRRRSIGEGAGLSRFVRSLPEGQRNKGLFWAGNRAREAGILERIEPELLAAAQEAGLPLPEAARTIAAAGRRS